MSPLLETGIRSGWRVSMHGHAIQALADANRIARTEHFDKVGAVDRA
jgi:hypothetical protein